MISKKKIFGIISIFVLLVLVALFVPEDIFESDDPTPGELEGVWYHPDLDCMDGIAILIFEDGRGFDYFPPHKEIHSIGEYKKLADGKYELTRIRRIKPGAAVPIINEYKERLPDGSTRYTKRRILTPHKNYMSYEIITEIKLKRVTDVPKFRKLYEDFKKLLKEKGVNQEE